MTTTPLDAAVAGELLDTLRTLRTRVADDAARLVSAWKTPQNSAVANLAAYVALRRHDLRPVQQRLESIGLTSLHRSQQDVLGNLDLLIYNLALHRGEWSGEPPPALSCAMRDSHPDLDAARKEPEWMVTLPPEAASDPQFVDDLVAHGMSIARINCAHDDAATWLAMIARVRAAASQRGRSVRVLFELAGNKTRTTAVQTARGHKRIKQFDTLLLTRGSFLSLDDYPAQAAVNLPPILDTLRVGDPVSIDDGHASGVVEAVVTAGVVVRIERARAKGVRIRPNKGLNFPTIGVVGPSLQDRDFADLDLLLEHADLVGQSFVQTAEDLRQLQRALQERLGERARTYGVVAKIETPLGIRNLPEIIAAAADRHPLAIMIARGDLGVELGFDGLADAQETIQDLCEAARVPVIWATEVLAHFTKRGTHTRGELTDAALGTLADCVMLNKGPFVCDALTCLQQLAKHTRAHRTRPGTRLAPLDLFPDSCTRN